MKALIIILILGLTFAACNATGPQPGDALKALDVDEKTGVDTTANMEKDAINKEATSEEIPVPEPELSTGSSGGGGGASSDSAKTETAKSSDATSSSSSSGSSSSSSSSSGGPMGPGYRSRYTDVYESLSEEFGEVTGDDLAFLEDKKARKGDLIALVSQKILFTDGIGVHTAATMVPWDDLGIATRDSEEFADRVFVPAATASMRYEVQLSNLELIQNISDEEPLMLPFLGRYFEIVDRNVDTLVAVVGQRVTLNAGETFVVEGKEMTFLRSSSPQSSIIKRAVVEWTGTDRQHFQILGVLDSEGIEFDSIEVMLCNNNCTNSTIVFLDANESISFFDSTLKFVRSYTEIVDPTTHISAVVEVDGVTKSISLYEEKPVNGLKVQVTGGYNAEGIENDWASFIVGTETEVAFDDNDPYYREDEDDPAWVWDLSQLEQGIIAIDWALDIDRPDENDNLLYERPLYEGERYNFPEGFVSVMFESIQNPNSRKFEIETSNDDLYNSDGTSVMHSGANVIKVSAFPGDDTGLMVVTDTGIRTDTIYLYANDGIIELYVKEINGSKALYVENYSGNDRLFQFTYSNLATAVFLKDWNGINGKMQFLIGGLNPIEILELEISSPSRVGFTFLGDGSEDSNLSEDLMWNYSSEEPGSSWDLSSREADIRLASGIVIEDPDARLSGDRLIMHLPEAMPHRALIKVYQEGYVDPDTKPVDDLPDVRDLPR